MDTIDEGKSNRHVAVTSKYNLLFPISDLSICYLNKVGEAQIVS